MFLYFCLHRIRKHLLQIKYLFNINCKRPYSETWYKPEPTVLLESVSRKNASSYILKTIPYSEIRHKVMLGPNMFQKCFFMNFYLLAAKYYSFVIVYNFSYKANSFYLFSLCSLQYRLKNIFKSIL